MEMTDMRKLKFGSLLMSFYASKEEENIAYADFYEKNGGRICHYKFNTVKPAPQKVDTRVSLEKHTTDIQALLNITGDNNRYEITFDDGIYYIHKGGSTTKSNFKLKYEIKTETLLCSFDEVEGYKSGILNYQCPGNDVDGLELGAYIKKEQAQESVIDDSAEPPVELCFTYAFDINNEQSCKKKAKFTIDEAKGKTGERSCYFTDSLDEGQFEDIKDIEANGLVFHKGQISFDRDDWGKFTGDLVCGNDVKEPKVKFELCIYVE